MRFIRYISSGILAALAAVGRPFEFNVDDYKNSSEDRMETYYQHAKSNHETGRIVASIIIGVFLLFITGMLLTFHVYFLFFVACALIILASVSVFYDGLQVLLKHLYLIHEREKTSETGTALVLAEIREKDMTFQEALEKHRTLNGKLKEEKAQRIAEFKSQQ